MSGELVPTSNVDCIPQIGEKYIPQVRTFGALGYAPDRICNLLGLRRKEKIALTARINLPGDTYYDAYNNGTALGEYNIDAELAKKAEAGDIDAINTLEERKKLRVELDIRKQLFGV